MARRKSLRDIGEQVGRITNEMFRREGERAYRSPRIQRVNATRSRYMRNIQRTATYRGDKAVITNIERNNPNVAGLAFRPDYERAFDRMVNREYPQSVYMGLNQG